MKVNIYIFIYIISLFWLGNGKFKNRLGACSSDTSLDQDLVETVNDLIITKTIFEL